MFARFRRVESNLQVRLQVSIAESRRVDGRIRGEHIAALGSVGDPATIAERVAFWGQLHRRLAALSNRIGADDHGKIIGSIHARIPMVTIDEQRVLQRENAEADERFWAALQDMNASTAEGQRGLAANASRKALRSFSERRGRKSGGSKRSSRPASERRGCIGRSTQANDARR